MPAERWLAPSPEARVARPRVRAVPCGWGRALLTVRFRDLDRALRLLQVRAGDHELRAADVPRPLDDVRQVVLMRALAVVHAPEDRVAEVDADLGAESAGVAERRARRASLTYVRKPKLSRGTAARRSWCGGAGGVAGAGHCRVYVVIGTWESRCR